MNMYRTRITWLLLLLMMFENDIKASITTTDNVFPAFVSNQTLLQKYKTTTKGSIDNSPSNPICYCIGSTCYYCAAGLYCNDDRSGCCPKPHCNNNCGKYCVCPGYLCCDNHGTCRKDYPTCCDEICCKSNTNCCGKGCCEKENRCCKDKKKSYYCIERKKDNYLYFHESVFTDKEDSRLNSVNMDYFKKMCALFAEGTRKQNPKKVSQFATMTLNMASVDGTSLNKFDPFPIIFNLDEQKHNYDSASPLKTKTGVQHAETRVVEEQTMRDMLKWFGENRQKSFPQPPSVYLFTYLSPCDSCLQVIANLRNELKVGEIFVAWHLTYSRMKQSTFLAGLENFFEKGIRVVYNLDGLCFDAGSKPSPPLFQSTFYESMTKTYSGKTIGNCNANEISTTFAKFANWVVWKCQGTFNIDNPEAAKDNVANCLKEQIDGLNPKVDPCMNLPEAVQSWIDSYWPTNKLLLLSPPLNPNAPTTISNDVNDLRGNYNQFCFQVNFNNL